MKIQPAHHQPELNSHLLSESGGAEGGAAIDTVKMHTSAARPTHPGSVPVATDAHQAPRRSFGLRSLFWLMQIVAALAAGYWIGGGHGGNHERIDLAVAPIRNAANVVPVTVGVVTARQVERSIEAVGTLHGYDELTLKTKISGRVAKVHHDFGDKVSPGQLLLEIEPTDALLAVEQAQRSLNSEMAKWGFANVPEPNADLTQLPTVVAARLKVQWNQSQLARLNQLKERGSVIAEEIEQAKTNAMVSESDYANQLLLARAGAATAQLKKAELDIAQQQLKDTKIYAPTPTDTGSHANWQYTITERVVTQGAWLAAGSDLFRMVVDETLKLRLTIPEKHVGSVRVGQSVEVSTLSLDQPVLGTVTRVGPSVDTVSRTFQIEAEVPNPQRALKAGSFAKARVIVAAANDVQTVPTNALVTFAGVHKIFLVENDQSREVQVKLGEQTDDWVEIVDPPLANQAVVVTSGQSKLADGVAVRIRRADEENEPADAKANGQAESTHAIDRQATGEQSSRNQVPVVPAAIAGGAAE